jgi:amino acid adenylation domain-containing protein
MSATMQRLAGFEHPFPHELFELRASAAPDAVALRFRDQRLCYGELNARANQLARALRANGVGREDRVVVAVEPGFEIVIALLAILKLGAVYVPIDPTYPVARLRTMLEDTRPAIVLTLSGLSAKLPHTGVTTLELDREDAALAALSDKNLGVGVEPRQPAYVYYTSGTTGTPKGVLATQGNLASYIGVARRRYGFTNRDIGAALARFSFSISMFELLSPLVAGGTLLLLERAHVLDLARLSNTLRELTFFHAGPSLLRSLLDYIRRNDEDFSAFDGIRHASSGGDMVPLEVLEGLLQVFQNAEVFVIYGCSEISCMGTTYAVPRDVPLTRSYVGKPFEGMSLRVVDEQLSDVAVGVVGEVLFAGPGVVKGYLNRPELTAERFLELEGGRFYRTGDRGRLNAEDLLELVGRSDFQVKLGGIRIELGEIEHHLRRAPGVANGVVTAWDSDSGEKTLVAYVVLDPQAGGDAASREQAMRRYLAEQLPDYMVPTTYVEISALPLNHNLKVDRKALPAPSREAKRAPSTPLRRPETATEQSLAALWTSVLGVDAVALDDNFFDLGGSSLLALRLIVEVDRQLGVSLTGLEVLREPLEMQARLCEQRSGQAPRTPGARTAAGGDAPELFHFGQNQSLFGVLHGPSGGTTSAALICAPLGHEYTRAHFVLQRVARRLAARGVPTLRFDYYGCRDSLGESREATCARWQSDIVEACGELKRRTGARRLTAIGVRLGATLLSSVADGLQLAKLVLWDPIESGAQYLATLAAAHRRYLRSMPLLTLPRRAASLRASATHELLGVEYSEAGLQELGALTLNGRDGSCPVEILSSDSAWLDLTELEDMLPDLGASEALAQMVLR